MKSLKSFWSVQRWTLALLSVLCVIGAQNARAATYTVTNTKDSGTGSLRQAITSANATTAADTISFNISGTGVHTIAPVTPLPTITSPVTIDGTTQPGYQSGHTPRIELSGATASKSASGIKGIALEVSNCTVSALTINRWNGDGIFINKSSTTGCHVHQCLIGLDASGSEAARNVIGILIGNGAHANFIGGEAASRANFISGNSYGIAMGGAGTSQNFVTGNTVGVDISGDNPIPNTLAGVYLFGGATNNTIGSNNSAYFNIISGNTAGIEISDSTTKNNLIEGNFIGLDYTGTNYMFNSIGIYIHKEANNNIIGASNGGANYISGNLAAGLVLSKADNNVIAHNVIGLDPTGAFSLDNSVGINVSKGSQNNSIGPDNLIGGNKFGILISDTSTSGNKVFGNLIGTNADGTGTRGNGAGIVISDGATNNTIGGTTTADGNLISGNTVGVTIKGAGTSANAISGNTIGTNAAGTATLSKQQQGVFISEGASSNIVGGAVAGAGNLISGNAIGGVEISGDGTDTNLVMGNLVGLNGAATAAVPNGQGVLVNEGAHNTLIGGTSVQSTNFISGNKSFGVRVAGKSSGTVIEHNYIGTGSGGNGAFSNGIGVSIEGGSQFTIVGSPKTESDKDQIETLANDISNNDIGVVVKDDLSYNNVIRGNKISNNTRAAIDLGGDGPTANDDGDDDNGPNRLQNAPVITSVTRTSDDTGNEIVGTLNSAPSESFTIDVYYKSSSSDTGVTDYVGNISVTTDASGNASFDITSNGGPAVDGTRYTVTATRAGTGDTSEFSPPVQLPPNVAITSPASGSRVLGFSSVSGTASDADGIAHVDVYLVRYSDGKYWDGTAWGGGGSAILPASYNSTSGAWGTTGPFPTVGGSDPNTSLTDGDYDIIAIAYDSTGLSTRTDSVVTVSNHTNYTYTGRAPICPYTDSGACAAYVPGDARDFYDARNWSPNGVPTSRDTATIGTGFDVYLNVNDAHGNGIVLGGLNLAGGSFRGGQLSFNPAAGNANTFNWSGGTLDFAFTTINAAGKLIISGDGGKDLGTNCSINNGGTATFSSTVPLRGLGDSYIDNLNGSTFTLDNNGEVFSNYGGSNNFIVEVGAVLKKESKINDPTSVSSLDSWNYVFKGNLVSNTGTVDLTGVESLTFQNNTLITGSAHTRLGNSTLNTVGTVTVSGTTFDLDGGEVKGTLNTAGAILNWTDGDVNGTLNISANSSLNVLGTNTKDIGDHCVINNSGLTDLSDTGTLRGLGNSTFNNKSGGVFEVDSDADLGNYGGSNVFNNLNGATFKKAGGSDITQCDWAFNNAGNVSVSQGVFALGGDTKSTDSGTFNTTTPGIVRFMGGEHTLLANTAFNGTGKTQITGGTLTATGSVGAGTSSQGTTIEISGGLLTSTGTGAFNAFYGTFNWTGGGIGGVCNVGSIVAFNLSGTETKDIGDHGIINSSGHTTLSGTGVLRGLGNSTFNNKSGATFTFASDADLGNYSGNNVFNNLSGATIEKTVGTATTLSQIDWAFNNSGTTRVTQGVLAIGGDTKSTDSGTFTATSPGIVRFNGGDHTLKTGTVFNGTGKTQITSGTLTETGNIVAGSSSAGTTLEMSGGAIKGTTGTDLACYGTVNWTGGTIGGILDITAHTSLNLSGSDLKDIDELGVIRNAGTTTWTGGGALRGLGRSIFNNLSGGIFNVTVDGTPLSNYGGSNSFNNVSGAVFQKTGGKGITALDAWTFNAIGGQILISQGTLHSTNDLNINANTVVTGAGTLQLSGTTNQKAVLNSNSHVILDGTLNCTKGSPACQYASFGVFDWKDGTINGVLTFIPGTKVNLSGTDLKDIGDHGVINNQGTFSWTGTGLLRGLGTSTFNNQKGGIFNVLSDGDVLANYGGSNVFNNLAGATFSKAGGTKISQVNDWTFNNSGSILSNYGVATASGSSLEFDAALNLNGGTIGGSRLTRFSGTTLTITGTPTIVNTTFDLFSGTIQGTGSVATSGIGVLRWTNGTVKQLTTAKGAVLNIVGTTQRDIDSKGVLTNNGTATWSGGNIRGLGTSTIANNAGATFTDISKAQLVDSGGGNLFKNAGTFKTGALIGKTTMAWGFTQLGTGILSVDVTSTSTTGFDLYAVTGKATLAGTLQIVRPFNYVPAVGSKFKFLTHGSRSGTFTTVQNTTIDSTRSFQVQYNPSDVTLVVASKTTKNVSNAQATDTTEIPMLPSPPLNEPINEMLVPVAPAATPSSPPKPTPPIAPPSSAPIA